MSMAGVADLFRGTPRQPVGADGRMALSDHLRELRARIMKATLFLVAAFIVAIAFYPHLLDAVTAPYRTAKGRIGDEVDTSLVVNGITGGLMLQMKLCGVAAIVASSPVWLYQLWAFILPALHASEKKWSRIFAAVAGPLFIGGVALGYFVLPKGLEVLINFTPQGAQNLNDFAAYVSFTTRMLLVFGIAMEIPLFVVLLNLAGVVSGKALGRARPWIILSTFIFSAVATPSTDPFAMSALAITMSLLFLLSEGIARMVDRFRARKAAEAPELSDDEASPL